MAEVTVVLGDITTQQVDAIVNAANMRMRGGGGVDDAIHVSGLDAGPDTIGWHLTHHHGVTVSRATIARYWPRCQSQPHEPFLAISR